MGYDVVIRNGVVVDGTGLPSYRADVGIVGDRIARVGRIADTGSVEIDAEGHLRVRSRDVAALQRALPAVAQRLDVRLSRVEPLDDSLESVFEYPATG